MHNQFLTLVFYSTSIVIGGQMATPYAHSNVSWNISLKTKKVPFLRFFPVFDHYRKIENLEKQSLAVW